MFLRIHTFSSFQNGRTKNSPIIHYYQCIEFNLEPGQPSAKLTLLFSAEVPGLGAGTRCLLNFEEEIYTPLCLPYKWTQELQPCTNDPFFPLFIVESSRFQLLAGDHSTKNSFDADTCKLEQNLKAAPLQVLSLFNLKRGSC